MKKLWRALPLKPTCQMAERSAAKQPHLGIHRAGGSNGLCEKRIFPGMRRDARHRPLSARAKRSGAAATPVGQLRLRGAAVEPANLCQEHLIKRSKERMGG
jgi:hypothetical protein